MTAKELIEKLGSNTKANLWDIIIDGNEYNEDDTEKNHLIHRFTNGNSITAFVKDFSN